VVIAVFVVTGTATGALAGLFAAVVLAPVALFLDARGGGEVTGIVVVALVGLGLMLDGARLWTGWPDPPNSGRQVPREWSRLFDPRVTAALYGARLGVGPLTMLSTWTWWSVTIAAALLGPVAAVLVGTAFGFVRLATTVASSMRAERSSADHQGWFAALRRRQRPARLALTVSGVVVVVALAFANRPAGDDAAVAVANTTVASTATTTTATTTTTTTTTGPARVDSDTRNQTAPLIRPADLEDVVRTAQPPKPQEQEQQEEEEPRAQPPTADSAPVEPAGHVIDLGAHVDPNRLADLLVSSVPGFTVIDDPAADRFLDLTAASAIQPDPTEELALLETRGFDGGWTRAFRNDDTNDVAVASVYQFRDAAEAEFYLEDGLITIGGYGGRFFDVPDQPGVRGFVQEFDDGAETLVTLGAAFQAGPRWFLLYLLGSPETVTADSLIPVVNDLRTMAGLTGT
jgi:hypothetical protein